MTDQCDQLSFRAAGVKPVDHKANTDRSIHGFGPGLELA
jgi:hypothetical protein